MKQMITRIDTEVRARFFRGLANTSRLAILDVLREAEHTVSDVAEISGISISTASRHLTCLRECGLVESQQDWRHVRYRLANGVAELLGLNDQFIERVADRVEACQRPEMENGKR